MNEANIEMKKETDVNKNKQDNTEKKHLHKKVELPRGTLSLTYTLNNPNYHIDDLLGFAERINPKRAFLFVSKVLGRHIPVQPNKVRQAFTHLASQLITNTADLPEPIIVIGMAETAVGLSAGVHQALQKRYPDAVLLNSTRHAQDKPLFAQFSEDHSHASSHLIYQSDDKVLQQKVKNCKTLIMVDDEASTGQTCKNVVTALQQAGLNQLQQVHLATLVDWSLNSVTNNPFTNIEFHRHFLMSGSWQWSDNPNPHTINMPKLDTTEAGQQPILETEKWGRVPTIDSTQGLKYITNNLVSKINIEQFSGKRVLVLGSNEFVWLPFLLAEWLEKQSCAVKFGSLTRSPVNVHECQQDYVINNKLSFQDNYGLGMTNFVYNIIVDDWDLILLCIETASDSVDEMWHGFDNLVVITPENC